MKKVVLIALIVALMSACSFSKKPNSWEHKSRINLSTYTEAFLSAKELLAKSALKSAKEGAKQSADLSSLAKVYLGECALNIAVGVDDSCLEYKEIETLIDNRELDAYYKLLTKKIKKEQIDDLPQQYREFASLYINQDYTQAAEKLLAIKQTSSSLICASLMKEQLNATYREKLIERASYYGYKKAVLFWLAQKIKYTTDPLEVQKIEKTIAILRSP